jgi:Uma2 family endonuclease
VSAAVKKLITAEEFFQMPEPADGSQQELVRGVIVTMPPPGGRHGGCCMNVGYHLCHFVKTNHLGTVTSNDAGFISERDPDTVRGPDVAFWSRERLPELPEGYITLPPDLAVEVVSPGDHYSRIQKKLRHYLERGVRLVWIVDPEDRSVTVYRSEKQAMILGEKDTLTGEDVVPGFRCLVADLFA